MRYRIKIITYKTGRKTFTPQFRWKFFWLGIDYEGGLETSFHSNYDNRESALRNIDKHFAGNKKKQTIEFEYINK